MDDHIHAGILVILTVFFALILINITVRTLVLHFPNNAFTKALAYTIG